MRLESVPLYFTAGPLHCHWLSFHPLHSYIRPLHSHRTAAVPSLFSQASPSLFIKTAKSSRCFSAITITTSSPALSPSFSSPPSSPTSQPTILLPANPTTPRSTLPITLRSGSRPRTQSPVATVIQIADCVCLICLPSNPAVC